MTYAKSKTTQGEFVKAWWEAKDRRAWEQLKRNCPWIEMESCFNGMTYADKLHNIPNNALRRAGLKPIRRNGMRKKEWKKQQFYRSIAAINAEVIQPLLDELIPKKVKQITEQFADVGKMASQTADALNQFAESHFQEDEQSGFQRWLETEQKQPYIGRVMVWKNMPFLRVE